MEHEWWRGLYNLLLTTDSHTFSAALSQTFKPLSLSVTMHLAMAANAVVAPSPVQPSSLLRSSFSGVSVKLTPQSLTLSRSKTFTVLAATKKAVAVLKGNSAVEGVATLTQEDDGSSSPLSNSNNLVWVESKWIQWWQTINYSKKLCVLFSFYCLSQVEVKNVWWWHLIIDVTSSKSISSNY